MNSDIDLTIARKYLAEVNEKLDARATEQIRLPNGGLQIAGIAFTREEISRINRLMTKGNTERAQKVMISARIRNQEELKKKYRKQLRGMVAKNRNLPDGSGIDLGGSGRDNLSDGAVPGVEQGELPGRGGSGIDVADPGLDVLSTDPT